ncbi:MAG TPA: homoserine dehydrogenase [Gammaproteobacteria bacterium]
MSTLPNTVLSPGFTAGNTYEPTPVRILDVVLLGIGTVGSEFLRRLSAHAPPRIRLVGIANSTTMLFEKRGIPAHRAIDYLRESRVENCLEELTQRLLRSRSTPVIVDATASEAVARKHAAWLDDGIHVVTANKIASASGWVSDIGNSHYGDAATVGAGLPVLATIRRLRAAGDRVTRVEGILSGSLGFVFHALQKHSSFSRAVMDACEGGLAEPDPRQDLSGADVARKLAIIARAAGLPCLNVKPESLIEPPDEKLPLDRFLHSLSRHDAGWQRRVNDAKKHDCILRYVASLDGEGNAFIGVRELHHDEPLAQTRGADNCISIYSDAYHRDPLVIRGPGAGAAVTATALLADLAELSARLQLQECFHGGQRR